MAKTGKVEGEISVNSKFSIRSTAKVQAKVMIDELYVEPAAFFNASCIMKEEVK